LLDKLQYDYIQEPPRSKIIYLSTVLLLEVFGGGGGGLFCGLAGVGFFKPVRDEETGLFYLRSDGTAGCGLERFARWTQKVYLFSATDWSVLNRGAQAASSFEKVMFLSFSCGPWKLYFLNLYVPVDLFPLPEQNSSRHAVQLLLLDVIEPSVSTLNYNPHNHQWLFSYTALIG
jgi:hypothetical protein